MKKDYLFSLVISVLTIYIIWKLDENLVKYFEDRFFLTILVILGFTLYYIFGKNIKKDFSLYIILSSVTIAFMLVGYNMLFYSQRSVIFRIFEMIVISVNASYFIRLGTLIKGGNYKVKLSGRVVTVACFLVMFTASLVLLYVYYPGIFSTDVITCWKQAGLITDPTNRSDAHSFVYISMLALFRLFSDNIFWVCLFNAMLLAITMSFVLGYLYKRGLDIVSIAAIVFLYISCPFNLPLTISATKDVIFTIALLQLTFCVIKMLYEKAEFWKSNNNVIQLILSGIATALFRSNGMVAMMFVAIFIVCFYWKRKSVMLKAMASSLGLVAILITVKFPIYTFLHVESGAYGLASFPFLDGIWTNVYFNNTLDEEIVEYLEETMSLDSWRENYKMKYTNSFVLDYTKLDTKKSISGWLWCLKEHPLTTIRSRLCKTQSIWSVFQNDDTYYSYNISVESHPRAEEYGWYYADVTKKLRTIYCNYFGKRPLLNIFMIIGNGGWNSMLCLVLIGSLISKKEKWKMCTLIPISGSTIALLLCSCFSDYRYVWPMFLTTLIFSAVVLTKREGELVSD